MLKFSTIAVVVRDEKEAVKWYTEKLGFKEVARYPHWHTVTPPGAKVEIHLCPDSPPEKGNTGIAFSTKNCAKQEEALRKKGVRITIPTTKEEWGVNFMFADPDGNEFWVNEE